LTIHANTHAPYKEEILYKSCSLPAAKLRLCSAGAAVCDLHTRRVRAWPSRPAAKLITAEFLSPLALGSFSP